MSKIPCHIHNNFDIPNEEDVRNEVCKDLDTQEHTDGNFYCLLHLPDVKKSKSGFQRIINERRENSLKEIEAKPIGEKEEEEERKQLIYDYRYVFFPQEFGFNRKVFEGFADFGYSTFSRAFFTRSEFKKGANFTFSKFTQNADFNDVIFDKEIRFDNSKFLKEANFSRIKVNNDIHFDNAVFKGKANFLSARFNRSEKKIEYVLRETLPKSSFIETEFHSDVDFRYSHFCNGISFFKCKFSREATFRYGKFYNSANFKWIKFAGDTYFDKCKFRAFTDFGSAIFASNSDVFFRKNIFYKDANFSYVTFASFVTFESHKKRPIFNRNAQISFQDVRNESSAKLIFNQVVLRPKWFIKVDASNYTFADVRWLNVSNKNIKRNVESESANLCKVNTSKQTKEKIENPKSILKITCRQLAVNAENNYRLEEASSFRLMAMECERLEIKKSKQPFTLQWWYWLTSFYGESPLMAFYVLLYLVLIVFPWAYSWTDFQTCPKEKLVSASLTEDKANPECQQNNAACVCKKGGLYFEDAITHSLTSATLQNSEYRKAISFWAEFWTILEKIFAPLQAALLALAIRRKFMR